MGFGGRSAAGLPAQTRAVPGGFSGSSSGLSRFGHFCAMAILMILSVQPHSAARGDDSSMGGDPHGGRLQVASEPEKTEIRFKDSPDPGTRRGRTTKTEKHVCFQTRHVVFSQAWASWSDESRSQHFVFFFSCWSD